jgi:hypothetical protein
VAQLVEKILKQITRLFQRAREDAEEYADPGYRKSGYQDPSGTPKLAKMHMKLKAVIDRR